MQKEIYIGILVGVLISAAGFLGYIIYDEFIEDDDDSDGWTSEFNVEDRTFATTGNNTYFILQVGYRIVLEGEEDGEDMQVNITVLNETKTVGTIVTRVVEERELVNGELYEVSRNYFAIDTETNSVFYFGEEVDYYEEGVIVDHEGAWEAYTDDAKPGLIMPGIILLGSKYYQEVAPGIAEDRGEITKLNETVETHMGTFTNCLEITDTNALEPGAEDLKYYAAGIGIIQDEELTLAWYGFVEV